MMQSVDSAGIVCACFNVTLEELRRRKKANPGLSFEDFMSDTGAGTKCTACLLDLEFHFVADANATAPVKAGRRAIVPRRGVRRRIYDFVDGLAPKRPTVSRTVAPVVAGDGLEQYLWIANHPLLYSKESVCAPPHVYDVRVTGNRGELLYSERHLLEPGQSNRVDVSSPLARSGGTVKPFAVGMLSVETWSTKPGVRGTTRPQIEILTAGAACAVHTQGATPHAGNGSLWVPCRPGDDRIFLVFMNPAPHPCRIQLRYPADRGDGAVEDTVQVAAHAAGCYEVDLASATHALGEIIRLAWRADGPHKAYFLCSTPNLDRFSVDHI
jgi:hypothetical protein